MILILTSVTVFQTDIVNAKQSNGHTKKLCINSCNDTITETQIMRQECKNFSHMLGVLTVFFKKKDDNKKHKEHTRYRFTIITPEYSYIIRYICCRTVVSDISLGDFQLLLTTVGSYVVKGTFGNTAHKYCTAKGNRYTKAKKVENCLQAGTCLDELYTLYVSSEQKIHIERNLYISTIIDSQKKCILEAKKKSSTTFPYEQAFTVEPSELEMAQGGRQDGMFDSLGATNSNHQVDFFTIDQELLDLADTYNLTSELKWLQDNIGL